jgi:hypothetical protein
MVASLQTAEGRKLAQCEEVIERGLDSFIEVGNALLIIREERLYRNDYDDFETYCAERWEMSGRHAHRLVDSVRVMQNLGTDLIGQSGPLPSQKLKETHLRPLVALPPTQQKEAWTTAVKSSKNGKPTAKQVADSVLQIKGVNLITVGLNGDVKNSINLQRLKAVWKTGGIQKIWVGASSSDRKAFVAWINRNP